MPSWLAYLRSHWQGLRRPGQVDADMSDEMRFHLEMEAKRLRERGLDEAEAARQAAIRFGGVEKYRGAGRDALGFTGLRGVSVDVKLGLRMLRKYPGLTGVALLAVSLAIGAGAGYIEFVQDLLHGKLPFADADRIVGIQNWDQRTGDAEHRVSYEFASWRGTLKSFDELGAYRATSRNLITEDGRAEPVNGVQISASLFRIARVPPLLGRHLVEDDERPGAADVAVIGYDQWVNRFGSDPDVVGKTVRIGVTPHIVVGVMPQGFGFPIRHSLWLPLRMNEPHYQRLEGAPIRIFGRLAPGISIAAAQAELDGVARRTASDFPDTHRHIQPVVKLFVQSLWSAVEDSTMQQTVFYLANLFFLGLLVLCGANVATLVFARTATRDVEISVRTALGASRARIAGQLFAEGLVLSSIAAVLGLVFARFALGWVKQTVSVGMGEIMFWWDDRLSAFTLAYAAVLAIVAALIIGVIPALKATGARVQERLKHATGASASGMKLGGIWTGVIVTQVAVTLVFVALAGVLAWGLVNNGGDRRTSFPEAEYVALRLNLERDPVVAAAESPEADAQLRDRLAALYLEFEARLAAEPGVRAVTYASRLPGSNLMDLRLEVEGDTTHVPEYVRTASTGVNVFDVFQAPIVAGRSFTEADLLPGREVAVVDQTFVRLILFGRDAVGRRVRVPAEEGKAPGPWIEIVGVVRDLTDPKDKLLHEAAIFLPAKVAATRPLYVAVHAQGDLSVMMPRLRFIAAEIDPALRLDELMTFDQLREVDLVALEFFARLSTGIGAVALLLAMAGVYALMSFTVSRQTTEIGIRVALGANPRRIIWSTLSRALVQVGLGLAVGIVPALAVVVVTGREVATGRASGAIVTLAVMFMLAVTAVACAVPARRALRIQPTDALKTT